MAKNEQKIFAPCSINQRIILMDEETDVILTGGGEPCASTLKTFL